MSEAAALSCMHQKQVALLLQGGKSRIDFVLGTPGGGDMYVEVKSVTLAETFEAPDLKGGRRHPGIYAPLSALLKLSDIW